MDENLLKPKNLHKVILSKPKSFLTEVNWILNLQNRKHPGQVFKRDWKKFNKMSGKSWSFNRFTSES